MGVYPTRQGRKNGSHSYSNELITKHPRGYCLVLAIQETMLVITTIFIRGFSDFIDRPGSVLEIVPVK